ncbi:hypothetical protein STEG23_019278, partial [Scotinomys teguina]
MGRRQCKSAYNIIKNKTTPESSPPPTPKSDYCNADKAEENDLKKSLMKMLEEAFEEKMKNVSKEIGENTNKKLEEINKEIEEKKSKKLEEMNNEIEEKKNKKLEEMNNEIEEKKNKRVEEMNKEIEEKRNKKLQELDKEIEEKINKKLKEMNKEIEEKTNKKLEEINKVIEEKTNKKLDEINKEIEDKTNKKLEKINKEIDGKKTKELEEMKKEIEEKEQTLALRKEGIGVVLDSELPHLIGIDDDLLSTGIILYHLKEGQTYVGREDASTEQDIVLHGLDLESEHCVFENVGGMVTLIPLSGSQCSVNGIQIVEATQLNQGAVILLGRTNMFRFNHPKEAAKLREKRKSGLLSSFSLSMTDLSKSCENLSAVMLYNPGLEFERQQREELEKLESKRKLIEEMEEKQKSDKAELERMQQEVETRRKETEMVQRQIRKQEESLKRRSFHIENKLKDLLAEKERFEEERLREQQGLEEQRRQEEESFCRIREELRRLQELNSHEQAEKAQIFQELDRLHKEQDAQSARLQLERRRLEEEEKEQVLLVAHLEEQLRERQETVPLLCPGEFQRAQEEKGELEVIQEALLQAKEAGARGDHTCGDEPERAQQYFLEFKRRQLVKLANLEKDLVQQRDLLRKEVQEEQEALEHVRWEVQGEPSLSSTDNSSIPYPPEGLEKIKAAQSRLQSKEHQLRDLLQNHLPALLEEKQRALDILDRGALGLDNTLYQVEKEMEEKEEQITQYQANACQLQQLQATFEFTANIARQEEKVRKKEKEILESQEKQQREALEQAVAKLEQRHSALQRHSTLDLEIQEHRQKLGSLHSMEQSGLWASLEAKQEVLEKDPARSEHDIHQLKQKICEADGVQRPHHGILEGKTSLSSLLPSAENSHLAPLMDARISAYIEEEVQRRLHDLHRAIGDASHAPADVMKSNEELHNGTTQRKLKYERMYSRSLGANPDDLKDPIKISIPRYVLCGQGKDEHFEFEVKISVLDETWTVFRRYSRFREMHKTLKLKYAE